MHLHIDLYKAGSTGEWRIVAKGEEYLETTLGQGKSGSDIRKERYRINR